MCIKYWPTVVPTLLFYNKLSDSKKIKNNPDTRDRPQSINGYNLTNIYSEVKGICTLTTSMISCHNSSSNNSLHPIAYHGFNSIKGIASRIAHSSGLCTWQRRIGWQLVICRGCRCFKCSIIFCAKFICKSLQIC